MGRRLLLSILYVSPPCPSSHSFFSMEVEADLRPILGSSLVRLDSMRIKQIQNHCVYTSMDELASLSCQAANLRSPLTSCDKLVNSDHVVYLKWRFDEERGVSVFLGYAKVGHKNLFLHDMEQKTYEGSMLCLLDFYVHFAEQRQGHGKEIFDYILQMEKIQPYQIALDNPTVTLLAFMHSKYSLYRPIWQNTNFVVFPEMFCALSDGSGHNGQKAPDGWWRPSTPRRFGGGSNETRWLDGAISGHPAKGHAMSCPVDADQTTEGTLANRANQARARKAHILSSKPLW
ncbi:hypothetical protein PFISCL1PPCAC_15523 [Pristionchus fissidentatus]|uniref:Alpha-tubulin N-acetyltransferase n=1 Tax=Pristionchus fissidentatus TaxID=1538716 RepID=A0AAV5VWQ7_9BILA|nr:hypothetical protein PFISCL1PPCAC_15523 [Pristionchus fissidentatus]